MQVLWTDYRSGPPIPVSDHETGKFRRRTRNTDVVTEGVFVMPNSDESAQELSRDSQLVNEIRPEVSPRLRLLEALAMSISEVGYTETTVADIVRRAKTSRRTFYDHFSDREACLVALLTSTHRTAIRTMAKGVDPSAEWTVQIRQAVEAWIDYSDAHAPVLLSWIREAPALGPAARTFKDQVTESYIKLIQTVSSSEPLRDAGYRTVPRARAVIFIGGLRELAAMTVESGGKLRDIADDAVDAAILLFSSAKPQ